MDKVSLEFELSRLPNPDDLLDVARAIMMNAHHGQTRRGSNLPYHTHPEAVAEILRKNGESKALQVLALLHDVLEVGEEEWSAWTVEALLDHLPEIVVTALAILHHPKHEPYSDYIARVAEHSATAKVKLADIEHNTGPESSPSPRALIKYSGAIEWLKQAASASRELTVSRKWLIAWSRLFNQPSKSGRKKVSWNTKVMAKREKARDRYTNAVMRVAPVVIPPNSRNPASPRPERTALVYGGSPPAPDPDRHARQVEAVAKACRMAGYRSLQQAAAAGACFKEVWEATR